MWDEKSPQNNTAKQSRFDLGSEGSNAFDSWCAICNPFSFFILGKNNVQMLIFICPLYFPGRHTVPLNSLPQGIWQMQGQGLPDVSVTAKASGQGWEYTPLTRKRKKKGYLWSHLKESGTGFHQDKKEVRAWPVQCVSPKRQRCRGCRGKVNPGRLWESKSSQTALQFSRAENLLSPWTRET